MAFEITCGQCGGRLLVEQAGVIVACPLCEAHLSVPDVDAASETDLPAPLAEPTTADVQVTAGVSPVSEATTSFGADIPSVADSDGTADVLEHDPVPNPGGWISHSSPNLQEFVVPADEPVAGELFQATEDLPDFSAAAPADPNAATIQLPANAAEQAVMDAPTQIGHAVAPQTVSAPVMAAEAATQVLPSSDAPPPPTEMFSVQPAPMSPPPAPTTVVPPPHAATGDVVPRQWFIMVAGYASAVTIALVFLLFTMRGGGEHALESLPDLVPPMDKSGHIGMKKVPPELDVAPGHELRIGDSQRFGNVRVTPVRVSRSPIRFEHAFGKQTAHREPTQPVLKLTLRFENVSSDQEFAPLDATLLYKRIFDKKAAKFIVLNFLSPEADRRSGGELHYLYDLPEFSEYVLAGQDLNHPLKPGETWETYVPSEEGIAAVEGEWVWRVLFRKGYNFESKRGVTTLIDVRFAGDEVATETAG
ncbi:MAG TPA: hypothetical protein VM165_12515 [Planctomycetaceae bacterium]|nr:hypothetical protein [Planctomycetaceae bacterium]